MDEATRLRRLKNKMEGRDNGYGCSPTACNKCCADPEEVDLTANIQRQDFTFPIMEQKKVAQPETERSPRMDTTPATPVTETTKTMKMLSRKKKRD